jgi:hypothetical protein
MQKKIPDQYKNNQEIAYPETDITNLVFDLRLPPM